MHSYPLRFIMPEADKMKSPAYGEYHAEQWTCDQPTNCRWLTLWRILRRTVDLSPNAHGRIRLRPITKLCSFLYWTELLPQMNHQWKKAFETLDRGIFITYVN